MRFPPLRIRGWRLWLAIAVAAIVALRAVAPAAIRWAIESQGTQALGVPVRVADVDLWLVFGGIAVEDLRVGQRTVPLDVPAIEPASSLLSWSNAYARIGWLDLPFGRIRIRDLEIDEPVLRLLRGADGHIDPLPPPAPTEPAVDTLPEQDEDGGVAILLDRLAVRGADVRLLSADPTRPGLVEFELEELTLADFGLDEGGEISLGGVGIAGPKLRVLRDFAFEGAVPPVGPAPAAESAPAASAAPAPPAPEAAPAREREVAVKRVEIERAEFTLVMEDAALDVALGLLAENVTVRRDAAFPVKLTLEVAQGKLEVDAVVGANPLVFDGDVRWQGLALPPLLAVLGPGPAAWVRSGITGGDLHAKIVLSPLAVDPVPSRVSGTLSLTDLLVHDPAKEVVVGWESLEVAVDEVLLPPAAAGGGVEVALASVRVRDPAVAYTLPALAIAGLGRGSGADAEAGDPATALPDVAAAPPTPEPKISVGSLELVGGRIDFTDRTVQPFLRSAVRDLGVSARDVRWPQRDVRGLVLRARLPGQGRLDVRGGVRGGSGEVELALDQMGLTPFNPYATSYGGVAIDAGSTTLVTKLKLDPERIEADNRLVIHQLGVSSQGQSVVPGVGIPIDLALALLRDPKGDISLPVPVTVERGKTGVGIGAIVGGAIKSALLGALQSPLKGIGMIAGALGGGDEEVGIQPVGCLAGAAELAPGEEERIGALAEVLASRPGLGLTLAGRTGPADEEGLAERILLERIRADAPPKLDGLGFFQRRRLERALEERARGDPPALEAEDAGALARWIAAVEIPPDRRVALAGSRAEALRARLVADHGVPEARVSIAAPADAGDPGVVVTLAAAR
jgi:hypothetical protein